MARIAKSLGSMFTCVVPYTRAFWYLPYELWGAELFTAFADAPVCCSCGLLCHFANCCNTIVIAPGACAICLCVIAATPPLGFSFLVSCLIFPAGCCVLSFRKVSPHMISHPHMSLPLPRNWLYDLRKCCQDRNGRCIRQSAEVIHKRQALAEVHDAVRSQH